MTEIMQSLRESVESNEDEEKNEIYYTPKQKRVLKTIAENPHAQASEVADIAEVHPSYIPYIIERVDEGVVDNLHRLEEYLSEREEMNNLEEETQSESEDEAPETRLMETFGAKPDPENKPTVDDHERAPDSETKEYTFTKEVPVEVTVRFPDSSDISDFVEEEQVVTEFEDSDEDDEDDEEREAIPA